MSYFDFGYKQVQPMVSMHLLQQPMQPFAMPGGMYPQNQTQNSQQNIQQDTEDNKSLVDGVARDTLVSYPGFSGNNQGNLVGWNVPEQVSELNQPKSVTRDMNEPVSNQSLILSVLSQNPQSTEDLMYNYSYPPTYNYNYPPAYNYSYPSTYKYYGYPHQRYERSSVPERSSVDYSNLVRYTISPGTKRRRRFTTNSTVANDNMAVPHDAYAKSSLTPPNSNSFPCPICSKVFLKQYNLKSHMNSHSIEKPFQCSKCPKTFARSHDKKRHELLHNGVKNFKCEGYLSDGVTKWGCGKKFARSDALSRHFRTETGWLCIRPLMEEAKDTDKGGERPQFTDNMEHPQITDKFLHAQDRAQFPVRIELAPLAENTQAALVPQLNSQLNSQGDDDYYKSMMDHQPQY